LETLKKYEKTKVGKRAWEGEKIKGKGGGSGHQMEKEDDLIIIPFGGKKTQSIPAKKSKIFFRERKST